MNVLPFYQLSLVILSVYYQLDKADAKLNFVKEPLSQAVMIGHSLRLDCVAVDSLTAKSDYITYVWYFGNQSMIPSASIFANNSLYIASFRSSHYGSYQCTAGTTQYSNETLQSSAASIIAPYLDDFVVDPVSMTSNGRSSAVFTCTSGSSAPPPVITWRKDNETFTSGNIETAIYGVTGRGGSQQMTSGLQITSFVNASGQYSCAAKNPLTGAIKYSQAATLIINLLVEAPSLKSQPPNAITAAANLPFSLKCSISGYPIPQVTWLKNSSILTPDGNRITSDANSGQLRFKTLDEQDTGVYICNGSNSQGSVASSGTKLTVAIIYSKFILEPSNTSVFAGQPVSLQCSPPYSVPAAQVVWYKSNNPFAQRPGEFAVTVLNTGDLYFSNVQQSDEGMYSCVAFNDKAAPTTRMSRSAWLTVSGGPKILEPPVPVSVIKGRLLRLKCKVDGEPFPTVTWFKDSQKLNPDFRINLSMRNQELLINVVDKVDEGIYVCQATNKFGTSKSQPAKVNVIVPVAILQSVASVTVNESQPAVLKCIAYSDPGPVITWLKDGQVITYTEHIQKVAEGLYIKKAVAGDAGTYTCQVSNPAGMKSSHAVLTVYTKPQFTETSLENVVNVSDTVVLLCKAKGVPVPSIQWFYNGSRLILKDMKFSSNNSVVTINSINIHQTGVYKCIANNSLGRAEKSGFLKVQVAPVLRSLGRPGSLVVSRGRSIELKCRGAGIPDPVYRWFHNDTEIKPSLDKRVSFPTFNQLLVQFATENDAGIYKCEVTNILGRQELTKIVYVRGLPRPPKLEIPTPLSQSSIRLNWIPATQAPQNSVLNYVIQYSPKIGGNPVKMIVPSSVVSLSVDSLNTATEYLFWIAAQNEVGTGQFTGKLKAKTFESAPTAPRNLKVIKKTKSSLMLAWEEPEFKNGDITDYEVQYRQQGYTEFKLIKISNPKLPYQELTVVELKAYTPYEFKVRAATIERQVPIFGSYTPLISDITSMDAPTASPRNINVTVLTNTSVFVSWEPILSQYQHGAVNLYRISVEQMNLPSTRVVKTVKSTSLSTTLTGLLPWRYYSLTVTGVNTIGPSPPSPAEIFQTLPGVPSGPPQDIKLGVNKSSIFVTWKEVADDQCNSIIHGYILRYGAACCNWSRQVQINLTNQLNYTISELKPWTMYWIEIRAFTRQIPGGFGPFSQRYEIRTSQHVPGPVKNVKATAMSYSALISWDTPDEKNGVIIHYIVTYVTIGSVETTTDRSSTVGNQKQTSSTRTSVSNSSRSTAIASRTTAIPSKSRKRRREPSHNSTLRTVTTNDTDVRLDSLLPSTLYSVSVKAATKVGPSVTPVTITFTTLFPPTIPSTKVSQPMTSSTLKLTSNEVQATTSTSAPSGGGRQLSVLGIPEHHMPYFIGGCTAALLFILIVLIIVIICCCRKKRKSHAKPMKFFIPPPNMHADITDTTDDFSLTDNQRSFDDTLSSSSPSIASTAAGDVRKSVKPKYSQNSQPSMATPSSENTGPSSLSYVGLSTNLSSTSTQQFSGIPNPGYNLPTDRDSEPSLTTLSSTHASPPVATSTPDSKVSKKRSITKKHNLRMRNKNAAAIARDRERKSSFNCDDMDILIDNEAIIVFEERTVL
ncbi:contactin-6-like [Tubulanus polymorphus]|uniref:contactin-6-like n=1 Tax=Tubulanus polymorphus TaxID=672921 RepID=UPI003DA32BC8